MSDLWTEASRDVEAEYLDRHVTSAKVASAAVWPFLAASVSPEDYANRKALVAERIERIATAAAEGDPALFTAVHVAVQDGLDADFAVLHADRVAKRIEAEVKTRQQMQAEAAVRTRIERETLARVLAAEVPPEFKEQQKSKGDGESSDDEIPDFIQDKIDGKDARKTAAEYQGGSPKAGDTARCHKDGKPIEFFDGAWYHLNSDPAPVNHNDVYPPNKSERNEVNSVKTASTYCPNHGVYVGEGNSEQHNECSTEQRETKDSVRTAAEHKGGAWKAQVTGTGENVWSENGLRFDTPEEAKAYIDDLSMRWMGFDMGRVVPADTPNREPVDMADSTITHNYRTGAKKTAADTCPSRSDGGDHLYGSHDGKCRLCGKAYEKTSRRTTAGENPFPPKKDANEVDAGAPDPVDGASDVWTCPNCQGTDAYTQGGKELAEALAASEPIKCGGCQQVDSGQQEAQDPQQQAPNQAPVNPAQATRRTASQCSDCGGTGAVPAGGGEDPEDVDNGYVQCPTCGGSGTEKTASRGRHPFAGRTAARIDTLRRIVQNHQHEQMEGVLMDTFTASALVAVFDALSPENQAKFDAIPLDKLADLAFRATGAKTAKVEDLDDAALDAELRKTMEQQNNARGKDSQQVLKEHRKNLEGEQARRRDSGGKFTSAKTAMSEEDEEAYDEGFEDGLLGLPPATDTSRTWGRDGYQQGYSEGRGLSNKGLDIAATLRARRTARRTQAAGAYDPTDNPYLTSGLPDEMADGPRTLPTNADDSPVPSTTRPRQQPQGTHDTPQPVVQGFASLRTLQAASISTSDGPPERTCATCGGAISQGTTNDGSQEWTHAKVPADKHKATPKESS